MEEKGRGRLTTRRIASSMPLPISQRADDNMTRREPPPGVRRYKYKGTSPEDTRTCPGSLSRLDFYSTADRMRSPLGIISIIWGRYRRTGSPSNGADFLTKPRTVWKRRRIACPPLSIHPHCRSPAHCTLDLLVSTRKITSSWQTSPLPTPLQRRIRKDGRARIQKRP